MENNVNVVVKNNLCCGCSACAHVCPEKAIDHVCNGDGFYVPKINNNLCVQCGLCKKVCPSLYVNNTNIIKQSYMAIHKNHIVRHRCSSGGMFFAIVEAFFKKYENGIVFGASFEDDLSVVHSEILTIEDYWKIGGSKYVQSNCYDSFGKVRDYLLTGRPVLFSGTPCQVSGIINYLRSSKTDTTDFFTVDILCHGVPSPKIWRDYLKKIEKKAGTGIKSFSFRNKDVSWRGVNPLITYADDKPRKNTPLIESYGLMFGRLSLNHACHSCKYSSHHRVGDITLGDFWNSEQYFDNSEEGFSLVLVNTEKGETVFDDISNDIVFEKRSSFEQESLNKPASKHPLNGIFWTSYRLFGYGFIQGLFKVMTLKSLLRKKKK